jgi:hypothetical protein
VPLSLTSQVFRLPLKFGEWDGGGGEREREREGGDAPRQEPVF